MGRSGRTRSPSRIEAGNLPKRIRGARDEHRTGAEASPEEQRHPDASAVSSLRALDSRPAAGPALAALVLAGALAVVTALAVPPTASGARAAARNREAVVIGLRHRQANLSAFAQAVSTPGSGMYRDFASASSLARRFGATDSAWRRVRRYLRRKGIRNAKLDATRGFAIARLSRRQRRRAFPPPRRLRRLIGPVLLAPGPPVLRAQQRPRCARSGSSRRARGDPAANRIPGGLQAGTALRRPDPEPVPGRLRHRLAARPGAVRAGHADRAGGVRRLRSARPQPVRPLLRHRSPAPHGPPGRPAPPARTGQREPAGHPGPRLDRPAGAGGHLPGRHRARRPRAPVRRAIGHEGRRPRAAGRDLLEPRLLRAELRQAGRQTARIRARDGRWSRDHRRQRRRRRRLQRMLQPGGARSSTRPPPSSSPRSAVRG